MARLDCLSVIAEFRHPAVFGALAVLPTLVLGTDWGNGVHIEGGEKRVALGMEEIGNDGVCEGGGIDEVDIPRNATPRGVRLACLEAEGPGDPIATGDLAVGQCSDPFLLPVQVKHPGDPI